MTGIARTLLGVVVAILIFVLGAAAGWFGRGASSVRADVPTVAFYDGWRLACPAASQADKPCAISNDLVDTKTGSRVAQLTIVAAKSGRVLVVTVPYDVLLTAGIGLAFDNGKPRLYPYETCNLSGCIVPIALDAGLRAAMLQAKNGKLLLGSLDRRVVSIAFSLQGFNRADKALVAGAHTHNFLGMAI